MMFVTYKNESGIWMDLTSYFYDVIYNPRLTKTALKQPFGRYLWTISYNLGNKTISSISKRAGVWLFLCNSELWWLGFIFFVFSSIPEYFICAVVIKRKCLGSDNSQLCVEGLGSCWTPGGTLGGGNKANWPFLCKAAFLGSCRNAHARREWGQWGSSKGSALSWVPSFIPHQGAEGREAATFSLLY